MCRRIVVLEIFRILITSFLCPSTFFFVLGFGKPVEIIYTFWSRGFCIQKKLSMQLSFTIVAVCRMKNLLIIIPLCHSKICDKQLTCKFNQYLNIINLLFIYRASLFPNNQVHLLNILQIT